MNDLPLAQLDRARAALAECKTAMESKQIADVAEAARVYLERTNASVETVNRASEIRSLAERQMGVFLKNMPKNEGVLRKGSVVPGRNRGTATLAEIGITKKQSHVAQKLADIPEEEFRERIAVIKASGERLTTAKVLDPLCEAKTPTDDGRSNNLYSLNFYWKRASKADRKEFVSQNKSAITPHLK